MLMQLAPGTLIRWPWGGRGLQRDHMGRIRVVPRLVAVPVDGPEAIHLTGVRQVPVAHSCTCCQPGRCGCWCNGHLALHALPFHPEANRASAGSARERPVSRRSWPVRTSSASHEHCLPPPCVTASPPARCSFHRFQRFWFHWFQFRWFWLQWFRFHAMWSVSRLPL